MKCPNCGAQIGQFRGESYICNYCRSTFHRRELDSGWTGDSTENRPQEIHHYHHQELPDRLGTGLGCLCLLFFPLGWIIYFLYRDSSPRKAKTALIISMVMVVLYVMAALSGRQ